MTNPSLRASDEERQHVVAALERHTAAGRLSLEEFADRVGLVYDATTHTELAAVTQDLPIEPVGTSRHQRQLFVTFLIAAIAIVVLGVILAVGR